MDAGMLGKMANSVVEKVMDKAMSGMDFDSNSHNKTINLEGLNMNSGTTGGMGSIGMLILGVLAIGLIARNNRFGGEDCDRDNHGTAAVLAGINNVNQNTNAGLSALRDGQNLGMQAILNTGNQNSRDTLMVGGTIKDNLASLAMGLCQNFERTNTNIFETSARTNDRLTAGFHETDKGICLVANKVDNGTFVVTKEIADKYAALALQECKNHGETTAQNVATQELIARSEERIICAIEKTDLLAQNRAKDAEIEAFKRQADNTKFAVLEGTILQLRNDIVQSAPKQPCMMVPVGQPQGGSFNDNTVIAIGNAVGNSLSTVLTRIGDQHQHIINLLGQVAAGQRQRR